MGLEVLGGLEAAPTARHPLYDLHLIAALLFFTAALPARLANSQADAIRQGEQPQMTVQHRNFSRTAEQVTEPGLHLIGATQNTVFFYDVNEKRTIVIPQAQIVSIEVPE